MKRLVSAALLPLVAWPVIASAQAPSAGLAARTFAIDHYAKVARVSDVRVAPSGDRAVMVVARPNYESNAWESDLVLVDLSSRARRALTQRKTVSSPRWLAFQM